MSGKIKILLTWNIKTTITFKNIVKHFRYLWLISQSIDETEEQSEIFEVCLINSFYDPFFLQCCLPFQNLKSKLYKLVAFLLAGFCNSSCGLLYKSRNWWSVASNRNSFSCYFSTQENKVSTLFMLQIWSIILPSWI